MLIDSLERHGSDWLQEIVVVLDPQFSRPFLDRLSHFHRESSSLPLLFVQSPGPGVNRARNYGCHLAKSPFVAFLDDDVVLESSIFFEEVASSFRQPSVVAIGGDYITADGTDLWGRGYNALCSVWRASAGHGNASMLLGGCMVVRREVWMAAGGFDESIIYGGSEAMLVCSLRSSHGEVIYSPRLQVIHRTEGRGLAHWLWVAFRQGRAKKQTAPYFPPFFHRMLLAIEAITRLPPMELIAFAVVIPLFLLSSRCGLLYAALTADLSACRESKKSKVHSNC